MTKFKLSALVLALVFTLSACSSSSLKDAHKTISSPIKNSSTSNNSNAETDDNSGKNTWTNFNSSKSDINGVAYKFQSDEAANTIQNAQLLSLASDNKNVLHLGGQKIELAPKGLMPAYTITRSDKGMIMSLGTFIDGTDYMPNTQFGVFADKENNNTYVFTQGYLTPEKNMPAGGEVRYTGLSAYHLTNKTFNGSNWAVYGVDLKANFANKTLKGELTMSNEPSIVIDTKISGNSFSSDNNSDTQVKGHFYGEKAQELGGVYVNEKQGYAGAFSAKQW